MKQQHTVRIIGQEPVLSVLCQDGQRLDEVLSKNGFPVDHPCGGRGSCQKCKVLVNGREELSCQYRIHTDIEVEWNRPSDIYSDDGVTPSAERRGSQLAFVLDIGTTTLALALVSTQKRIPEKDRVWHLCKATNPQRIHGADIMSRIEYCQKNADGVKELQNLLLHKVQSMIRETLDSLGIRESIPRMYAAGNVTMLHLFLGESPVGIGVYPYTARFLEAKETDGSLLGFESVGKVELLPSLATFVGADIVSGLGWIGLPEPGRYFLLADLGTNAEIALWSDGRLRATAAAAGPCFEGANISCGMSALPGAVSSFSLDDSRKPVITTVGNREPAGICGTGLIDLIASLFRAGIIDETGYMEEPFTVSGPVVLTQADVRQYQLAKSAVCSAIEVLVKKEGISYERIDKVFVSGGFSSGINVKNAVDSGLFPEALRAKVHSVKNSCLQGLIRFACEKNNLSFYIRNGEYVDLSMDDRFNDAFMENMAFRAL